MTDEDRKAKRRAYLRAYFQQPEVKAKRRAYMRAYFQQPEVKAKRRALAAEERRLVRLARQMGLDRPLKEQAS